MQIQDMRHACIAGYHTKYTRNSVYMHVDRHDGGTALQKKLSAFDMNAEMNASLSTIKKTLAGHRPTVIGIPASPWHSGNFNIIKQ